MIRRSLLALLLLGLATAPALARDEEAPAARHNTPQKNFSHLHDDAAWMVRAFDNAATAAKSGAWGEMVRALQPVIDQRTSRESPGDAAPYVRAVHGTATYEGAWLVARHALQAQGPAALAAYQREFGGSAREQLARAAHRRDRSGLASVARRFLGLPAGRRAALTLVDLAIAEGERERALGWLQDLEDLEAVSREAPEALAPWRAARIARQAALLAKDEASRAAVEQALAAADLRSGTSIDAVPAALRHATPPVRHWTTTGGNAARDGVPPALGHKLRLRWFRGPGDLEHLADNADPRRHDHDRPSLWLPPRAVAGEKHLFVSDGQALHIYDLATGEPALTDADEGTYPGARDEGIGTDTDEDRRIRFGLLEGHSLTIEAVEAATWAAPYEEERARQTLARGPGWLVLAAVPDGAAWDWDRGRSGDPDRRASRDDHIQALHFDGRTLQPLWRAGGDARPFLRGGLPRDTRLYGAPLVYRGRVWVAGIRAAKATQDRWEAWLYALDLHTGRVVSSTHLGTGTPMRTARMDEVIPTSPAARDGRVVVGTSLGIVAAVDADDGRVRWAHRYNRAVETERGNLRNRDRRDPGLRTSSFSNEPPILTGDRCYLTPTDGKEVLVLFDRPRLALRTLASERIPQNVVHYKHLIEHIAGVDVRPREGRRGSLVFVGRGESAEPPGALVMVYEAGRANLAWPKREKELRALWTGIGATGFGAEPYGRALLTAEEIFVPQQQGIAVFELEDRNRDGSHFLALLDGSAVPKALRPRVLGLPYGNLVPVPGKGLVAVNATSIAFWATP